MADKKFLIEHNLVDAYKSFMHLCNEATYFSGALDEEGEDDAAAEGNDGGEAPQDGGAQDPNAAGGGMDDPNAMGGGIQDPNAAGGGMDDPNAMGGGMDDPNAMDGGIQDPNAMGGGMDDPNAMGGDMGMPPMDEEGEEDEVIDVDDITNAQEKTNLKVNKVGRNLGKVDDKLLKIMDVIKNLQARIDANNAQIENFKLEFERRNPTPTERLNLRSLDSYPFNANPKDYWEGKATQANVSGKRYEAYADNNEPVAKKEYVITTDDAKDYTDNSIRDSFHLSDDLRSSIEKIFDI